MRNGQFKKGPANPRWVGGRRVHLKGYIQVLVPGHPRADKYGYVYEHILVVEKALGKPLPPGAIPHHVNGDKSDNRNENLLLCQDENYHRLIHRRQRAYEACGHANWRLCQYCQQYDDPINMIQNSNGSANHRTCRQDYVRRNYIRKKVK